MDSRMLRYYEQELRHLRETAGEFAREYPKVAGRLGLTAIECADPYVERLLESAGSDPEFRDAVDFAYLPGRTAEILIDGDRVGMVGEVHPRVAASFDIDGPVAMFELDLDVLLPHVRTVVHYQPLSPYPSVEEDLAVIVAADVTAGRVREIIESFPLVRSASIFDVYTGPPIPSGRKSLAFSVSYQSTDHTLTDAEVAKQRERIVARLRHEVSAELGG